MQTSREGGGGLVMQKHTDISLTRIQNFKTRFLQPRLYPKGASCQPSVLVVHEPEGTSRPSYAQVAALPGDAFHDAHLGDSFGPIWATKWFRVVFTIPAEWKDHEVHFLWDSSSEALLYIDGEPLQAFNAADGADKKAEFVLRKKGQVKEGGEEVTLYLEMACNEMFGVGSGWTCGPDPPDEGKTFALKTCKLAPFDVRAWDLLWDLDIISDMAKHVGVDTVRGAQALYVANLMVNIATEDPETWAVAREAGREFLAQANGDSAFDLYAVGHCHIDTAWLWPYAETRRKTARSWVTQMQFMEDYPEYKFVASQAQQYEWLKQDYPSVYERLKAKVASGQFLPVGGTWVEMDCNIPSGESLVRQFLFGQQYFKREFGAYCTEFWLPDTFGYASQLPQIMSLAGINSFLTQKLSWNQMNKFPNSSFLWEGVDGTRVITHFPAADTYCAHAKVEDVLKSATNFKDKGRTNAGMLVFGHGDGGGGPDRGMLERLRRLKNVDGMPRVQIKPPVDFFTRIAADAHRMVVWVGELRLWRQYFELHRGTYTTQAKNKLHNRKTEFLLHDIEFLSAVAQAVQTAEGHAYAYPAEKLAELWKLVLLNQFHDVIPGSSIKAVYEDSDQHYAHVYAEGAKLLAAGLAHLFGPPLPAHGAAGEGALVTVNTTSYCRKEVVEVDASLLPTAAQVVGAKALVAVTLPPYGFAAASLADLGAKASREGEGEGELSVCVGQRDGLTVLENSFVRAVFELSGALVSFNYKPLEREVVPEGRVGNKLVLFDDNPQYWDAWDVDVYHLEKRFEVGPAESITIAEKGPLRAAVEVTYKLSATSTVRQRIVLTAFSSRLDFQTHVDWHEKHKFLKVEFPVDVRSSQATYDTAFAHIQRPTHFNTTQELAKFEVCGHKWADLSESGFGVAVLNDCKYGYATHANVIRLSLLRSPTSPDPTADIGEQAFTYALLPHADSFQTGGVIEEAFKLNAPLLTHVSAGVAGVAPSLAASASTQQQQRQGCLFSVSHPSVVLETVKKAEEGAAGSSLVLRAVESWGGRRKVRIHSHLLRPARVTRVNLLEEPEAADAEPLECKEGVIELVFKPFQIITLKLDLH